MGRAMNPKGGDDRVYTPDELALKIVRHFKPWGLALEPCAGKGAFVRAFQEYGLGCVETCEIDDGKDFLTVEGSWNWIVTNPPWSKFREFLIHAMRVADNVVFLANLNAWVTKARMREIESAGFRMREWVLVDTPEKPWPQAGFQLAAVYIQRGFSGDLRISYE